METWLKVMRPSPDGTAAPLSVFAAMSGGKAAEVACDSAEIDGISYSRRDRRLVVGLSLGGYAPDGEFLASPGHPRLSIDLGAHVSPEAWERMDMGAMLANFADGLARHLAERVAGKVGGMVTAAVGGMAQVELLDGGGQPVRTEVEEAPQAGASAPWTPGEHCRAGACRTYGGRWYAAILENVARADWPPPAIPAVWRRGPLAGEEESEWPTWVQPTGAHDCYAEGEQVTWTALTGGTGRRYVSKVGGNIWRPDIAAAWEDIDAGAGADGGDGGGEGPDEWRQPSGAHDAYPAGARVAHGGKVWENAHGDGNVWEPGAYGWTEV